MGQPTLVLIVLLTLLGAAGCRPKAATTPHSTLTAYTRAIEEDRLDDAYALLSEESRGALSLDAFKDLVRKNPNEVKALLEAAKGEERPPYIRAEFKTDDDQVLTLIYEDGAWRIDQAAVNLYDQSEPRVALRSFVRAYERKRYDILVLFVPESQKEELTPEVLKNSWEGEQKVEMEQLIEGLRTHLESAQIELLGERATMSYGPGGLVEFVREQGVWKIEDLK